jgi:hypothetical protein
MKGEQSLLTKDPTTVRSGFAARTGIAGNIKAGLKRFRVSQPFNRIATSSLRTLLQATGLHSETIVKHLHRVGIVRRDLPNGEVLSLWSRADDWVSNQVYWRGWEGYEPETVPLFFRLATRARVTSTSAHMLALQSGCGARESHGRVYAFEPLADACERLKRNLALNELSNIHVVATAVGDVDEIAEFFPQPRRCPVAQVFPTSW